MEENPEGGFTARALGESIFTEADTLEEDLMEEAPSPGAWGLILQCSKEARTYQMLIDRLAPKSFIRGDEAADEAMLQTTGLDAALRAEFKERATLIIDPNPKCAHCGKLLFGEVH